MSSWISNENYWSKRVNDCFRSKFINRLRTKKKVRKGCLKRWLNFESATPEGKFTRTRDTLYFGLAKLTVKYYSSFVTNFGGWTWCLLSPVKLKSSIGEEKVDRDIDQKWPTRAHLFDNPKGWWCSWVGRWFRLGRWCSGRNILVDRKTFWSV